MSSYPHSSITSFPYVANHMCLLPHMSPYHTIRQIGCNVLLGCLISVRNQQSTDLVMSQGPHIHMRSSNRQRYVNFPLLPPSHSLLPPPPFPLHLPLLSLPPPSPSKLHSHFECLSQRKVDGIYDHPRELELRVRDHHCLDPSKGLTEAISLQPLPTNIYHTLEVPGFMGSTVSWFIYLSLQVTSKIQFLCSTSLKPHPLCIHHGMRLRFT